MKNKSKAAGLTLIELMLTVVASGIVFITVALILMMAFWTWRTNNAYADLRRNAALAAYMMTQDVRESSYDGLSGGAGLLTVESAVTNQTSTYTQIGETLIYTSGTDTLLIIPEGVQNFSALKQNDGVELTLELVNTNFTIAVTNQLFVNTRN